MKRIQGIGEDVWVLRERAQPALVGRGVFVSREEQVWFCGVTPLYFSQSVDERVAYTSAFPTPEHESDQSERATEYKRRRALPVVEEAAEGSLSVQLVHVLLAVFHFCLCGGFDASRDFSFQAHLDILHIEAIQDGLTLPDAGDGFNTSPQFHLESQIAAQNKQDI